MTRKVVKHSAIVGLVVAFALAATACSSGRSADISPAPVGETSPGGNTNGESTEPDGSLAHAVDATETDFAIALVSSTTPAGETTFKVANQGPATHEFVVFKSNLAPDALPVDSEGNVEEDGKGVTHLGEIEDITPGSSKDLTLTLDAAKYVVICNLPGHYKLGMYAGLTAA